jgi:hypothetical protein
MEIHFQKFVETQLKRPVLFFTRRVWRRKASEG